MKIDNNGTTYGDISSSIDHFRNNFPEEKDRNFALNENNKFYIFISLLSLWKYSKDFLTNISKKYIKKIYSEKNIEHNCKDYNTSILLILTKTENILAASCVHFYFLAEHNSNLQTLQNADIVNNKKYIQIFYMKIILFTNLSGIQFPVLNNDIILYLYIISPSRAILTRNNSSTMILYYIF